MKNSGEDYLLIINTLESSVYSIFFLPSLLDNIARPYIVVGTTCHGHYIIYLLKLAYYRCFNFI